MVLEAYCTALYAHERFPAARESSTVYMLHRIWGVIIGLVVVVLSVSGWEALGAEPQLTSQRQTPIQPPQYEMALASLPSYTTTT